MRNQNRVVAPTLARDKNVPLFFFVMLCFVAGLSLYFLGILFSIFRLMLNLHEPFRTWNQAVIWYSGVPSTLGLILAAADLAFLLPRRRRRSLSPTLEPVADLRNSSHRNPAVSALTNVILNCIAKPADSPESRVAL